MFNNLQGDNLKLILGNKEKIENKKYKNNQKNSKHKVEKQPVFYIKKLVFLEKNRKKFFKKIEIIY